MFCLLCHEKIARLRHWRTKSEFCCDEHAEIYKKQTLERLLTDQSASDQDAVPIALDALSRQTPADERVLPSAQAREEESSASRNVAEVLESSAASFDQFSNDASIEPSLGRGEPQEAEGDDLRELWRLAEEVDPSPGEIPPPISSLPPDWQQSAPLSVTEPTAGRSVEEQSAEDALQALRSLATGSQRGRTALDEESRSEPVVEVRDFRDELPPLSDFEDLLDELPIEADDADFPPALTQAELEATAETHQPGASFSEELPSVFERLTEGSNVVAAGPETSRAQSDFEDQPGALEELIEDASAAAEEPASVAAAQEPRPEVPVAANQLQEILEEAEALEVMAAADDDAPEAAVKDKVVAFPTPDAARQLRDKKEIERPRDAAEGKEEKPAPTVARKGMGRAAAPGGRKLALKPLLAMWGVEPSPFEPSERELAAMMERARAAAQTLAKADGIIPVKQAPAFPSFDRIAPAETLMVPQLGLYRPDPAIHDAADDPKTSFAPPARDPHFEQSCRHPGPLFGVSDFGGKQGRGVRTIHPSVYDLVPSLADFDASEMKFRGCDSVEPVLDRRTPSLGVLESHGASDRSARISRFVDTACLIFPEIEETFVADGPEGEFGADFADRLRGVLDPAFDIERPVGRELSDIV